MTCKAIRQLDQMQCAQCGLAWDVDDDDLPGCFAPRPAPDSLTEIKNRFLEQKDRSPMEILLDVVDL